MKKLMISSLAALVLVCCMFFGAAVQAVASEKGGFSQAPAGNRGGFTGPGPALVTVQQASGMRDDARVSLRGNIVQHLGGEKYLFRDASGTITVDIDDDDWSGQTVSPSDTVEIHGKVDKDWNSMEIDVKRILKK